jgi:hypothetical protein
MGNELRRPAQLDSEMGRNLRAAGGQLELGCSARLAGHATIAAGDVSVRAHQGFAEHRQRASADRHHRRRRRSAWLMKHKILEAMRVAADERDLDGHVEIDDAYLSGEFCGGKTGRGTDNKVPFVAAVQTSPDGHPRYACQSLQPPTNKAMAAFAASHIAPSATVVSDELWCFRASTLVGAEHQRIVTRSGKAAVRLPQFKAVNTLLGNLKTAITGTYHAFDFTKYAHRYLAEFQFRFNRRFNMKSTLHALPGSLVAARPSPERWLRLAEVHRQSGQVKARPT